MADHRTDALHRSPTRELLDGWDPVELLAADVRASLSDRGFDETDETDGPNDAELAARLSVLLRSTF